MNKFFENSITVLGGLVVIFGFLLLVGLDQEVNPDTVYADEYVFEEFIITEIDGAIHGETLSEDTGEGIYLDLSVYEDFPNLEELKVGDKIKVTYDAEDYENSIWDNILAIENGS